MSPSGSGSGKGQTPGQAHRAFSAALWGTFHLSERPKESPTPLKATTPAATSHSPTHAPTNTALSPAASAPTSNRLGKSPVQPGQSSKENSASQSSSAAPATFPEPEDPVSLIPHTYAAKPSLGSIGQSCAVRANMLQIRLKDKRLEKLFVYSIAFPSVKGREVKNQDLKKDMTRLILLQPPFVEHTDSIATDWTTSLYSIVDLSQYDDQFRESLVKDMTVKLPGLATSDSDDIVVSIKLTNTLSNSELQAYLNGTQNINVLPHLTAFNTIARKLVTNPAPSITSNVKVGKDKFFPEREVQGVQLQWPSGLEPRDGYFSSIQAFDKCLAINMHNVTTAFITQSELLDFLIKQDDSFATSLNDFDRKTKTSLRALFKATVSQLQVRYKYVAPSKDAPVSTRAIMLQHPYQQGRLRRINGFGLSARDQTFKFGTPERDISVEKYFNKHVLPTGRQLRRPDLPVINVGAIDHQVFIPAELLYLVPHQAFRGQINEDDMENMLKVAQHLPLDNATIVEQAFQAGAMFDRGPAAVNFGLSIDPTLMTPKARMLPIPDICYRGNRQERGGAANTKSRGGKWNLAGGKEFRKAGEMPRLAVLEIGNRPRGRIFYSGLPRALRQYGIRVSDDVEMASALSTSEDLLEGAFEGLSASAKSSGVILVALPKSRPLGDEYADVKRYFDTNAGISTVCVTGGKLRLLGNAAFSANLALKFNAKLRGENHVLSAQPLASLTDTMVVGADVTHPGVGAVPYCPSIAGIVASCNADAVTYPGSLRLQKSKQEKIEDLADMMAERLGFWFKRNNSLPPNILLHRDGVSDGQFAMVKTEELPKIREGCRKAGESHCKPDYTPKITLVVCGKRHHTRFYPPNRTTSVPHWWLDQNNNFKPGLVVDDPSIRNPYTFDFYLQSQRALNGTARPCHYFVIENELGWTSDQLQTATFNLCWVFATSLTPVSYAAPAYYADRLCERGRRYLWALLRSRNPRRPDDGFLLKGIEARYTANMTPDEKKKWQPTEDEKAYHACRVAASGVGDCWPTQTGSKNPQNTALDDVMFYI